MTIPWVSLMPLVILGGLAVLQLLAVAVRRHLGTLFGLTLVGLAAAFASLFGAAGSAPAEATALFLFDRYALFFLGLVILSSLAVALLSGRYICRCEQHAEEYYVLLVLATLGAGALIACRHFASFFLGLELLSISLYALIAYTRGRATAIEAGVKYLILAAASSAFLLLGMALLYARLGTMEFAQIGHLLRESAGAAGVPAGSEVAAAVPGGLASAVGALAADPLVLGGTALVFVGFGFKLAVVPFHMWTPDVYQGAPAPVTAFIATVSKGAVMALLLRFAGSLAWVPGEGLWLLLALIAGASMFTGNLLALRQDNLKRLLAYSSIAHLGYLLVAFLAGGERAVEAVGFYLVAYTVTTLAAFGVITVLSANGGAGGDREVLAAYRGLGRRQPLLAGVLALALLSLAGIPLTAGFVGKFLVLAAGVGAALWTLVILLAVNSAIAIYYYLRVIVTLYLQPGPAGATDDDDASSVRMTGGAGAEHGGDTPQEGGAAACAPASIAWAAGIALLLLTVALVVLGVYPQLVLRLIVAPA